MITEKNLPENETATDGKECTIRRRSCDECPGCLKIMKPTLKQIILKWIVLILAFSMVATIIGYLLALFLGIGYLLALFLGDVFSIFCHG